MNEVMSVAGFAAGLISLASIVYAFAFWRGRVDKQLSDLSEAKIPERLVKIETKQEVLWTVFSEQILTSRPNLAMRGSKFKLTDDAMKAIEEVKQILPEYNPSSAGNSVSSEQILIDLPKMIGIDNLKEIAGRHSMTLGELLAIISVELGIDI